MQLSQESSKDHEHKQSQQCDKQIKQAEREHQQYNKRSKQDQDTKLKDLCISFPTAEIIDWTKDPSGLMESSRDFILH